MAFRDAPHGTFPSDIGWRRPAFRDGGAYLIEICPAVEAEGVLARGGAGAFLNPSEAARLDALQTPKRRRDWLAGRIAAKRALRRALDSSLPLTAIEISNDEGGKPICVRPESDVPSFSISHSEAGGLCAAARGRRRVGADWETVAPRGKELLTLFAHESERTAEVESSPEAQTRLWTLKEAVLKLLGVGLACDPRDIRWTGSLELHGRAQRLWKGLGSPSIAVEHSVRAGSMICVAYESGTN